MVRPPGHSLIRRLRRGLSGEDRREPGRLNHISLGSHCHMAQVLKAAGLRTWSGPFDWIFSAPGMVVDCLDDDFAGLLDRSHYVSNPVENRPAPRQCSCAHMLYRDRHVLQYVFNHHDPATSEADYRFLREGVRRLRTALHREDATNRLYLMTERTTPQATIVALCERLASMPSRNHLTFVQIVPGAAVVELARLPAIRTDLTWLRLSTRSSSTGIRFADSGDDLELSAAIRQAAFHA